MHEAFLYDRVGGGEVRCRLCAHGCRIADGARGLCGVRENREGTLYSLVYGRPCASNVDPIEKKPLYHFLPGSRSYSVATVGCNMRCLHCQNWSISQVRGEITGGRMDPEDVVSKAEAAGCESIAYTYTEPTVFMEYARDVAGLARERGLRNVFVSNGYMSPESAELASGFIDADNVDLKSFSDKFYREVCGASLEPVLETLKALVSNGVWVEVTTLIIPGLNDSGDELREIASFIAGELGDRVPWHVSRFHPDHEMMDRDATDVEAVREAVKLGRDAGLRYVYAGNVAGGDDDNTRCPGCGDVVVERSGFGVERNVLGEGGRCPNCGQSVDGVWI